MGLFIIFGLFTRLIALGVFGLALGILLGSGWIGTTCLDEWQIGVLGIACGFTLFMTGSGSYSLDQYFRNKQHIFTQNKWFKWIGSGKFPIVNHKHFVLFGSLLIFALTLFTNQYFHGGVFGTLHNKSVKPKVEISNIKMNQSEIKFEVYRTEGVDVYGSFLIGIDLLNEKGEFIKSLKGTELSKFPKENIQNHYVAKVKPGKHSLIIPLGAKADLKIDLKQSLLQNKKISMIKLTDVSGTEWIAKIE